MKELDDWLKMEHQQALAAESPPDVDQTIAGVQSRIQHRQRVRRVTWGFATTAAMVLIVLAITQNPSKKLSSPEDLTVQSSTDLFEISLISTLLDSSEYADLYWSAAGYVMDVTSPSQPLPRIQLTATEMAYFTKFLEEHNS